MTAMAGDQLIAALLAALAVGAGAAALLMPGLGREPAVARRVRQLAARAPLAGAPSRRSGTAEVRLAILRRPRRGLRQRFERTMDLAGLAWRPRKLAGVAALIAALSALLALAVFKSLVLAVPVGLACGGFGPWLVLRLKRERRFNQCAEELPNALDIMARGLRAGRPIHDCVHTVGREARDPVGREFRLVEDEQVLGASMAQAMERMAERLPIDETRFLAIAISVQSAEGGALSETLANLARTLRERRRVARKLASMSAEQTMSAKLLAILPVAVLLLVYQLNPQYIGLLFNTSAGKIMLGISVSWVLVGFVVLSRMTRIEV